MIIHFIVIQLSRENSRILVNIKSLFRYVIYVIFRHILKITIFSDIWRPPSLNELTQMIFNMELTHLGSEASIYQLILQYPCVS